MAVSALSPSAVNQWITPQEQVDRLHDDMAQFVERGTSGLLGSEIEHIVAEYVDPNLTNWHTALDRIGALPDAIPALPCDIVQILNSDCPIRSGESKPDGTTYKVTDTHSLYLIPPGSLRELAARIQAYGERSYPASKNPLRFRVLWDVAYGEHGDVPGAYEWVLISNDVLKGSRGEAYVRQAQMVADLSRKAFANYEVPSLREFAVAVFLHKVATGESLYPKVGAQDIPTYTRVQEITSTIRLMIGSFGPTGMCLTNDFLHLSDHDSIGIALLRRVRSCC